MSILQFEDPRSAPDISRRTDKRAREPILDLIIPAYNEERRLGRTLTELGDIVAAQRLRVRVTVVDNASVDGTTAVVDSVRLDPSVDVRLVSCAARGKGAAVRAGVLLATAPYVGYCDADLPVPAETLSWAIDLLNAGWDVVIGSRRCAGAAYKQRQGFTRRIGSAAFRVASARLRGQVADSQCGFKFCRTDVARGVFEDCRVTGFSFDLEVVARLQQFPDIRLIEMPVPWSDQEGSSFNAARDGLRSFAEIFQVSQSVRGSAAGVVP